MDMTEATLQTVIKGFSLVIGLILIAVVGTLVFIIIRDGNNVLVSDAYSNLVDLAKWGIGVIGAVIVGKPVASGVGALLQGKAIQSSTTNSSVIPASIATNTVPNGQVTGQPESTITPPDSSVPGAAL